MLLSYRCWSPTQIRPGFSLLCVVPLLPPHTHTLTRDGRPRFFVVGHRIKSSRYNTTIPRMDGANRNTVANTMALAYVMQRRLHTQAGF